MIYFMSDSEELRKIAKALLDTSERLKKEAAELTRRAEVLDRAIVKNGHKEDTTRKSH
jgi:hypothetical protein